MERRIEILHFIVETRLKNWNKKIKAAKCGKVATERSEIYVKNCEKTTGNKV